MVDFTEQEKETLDKLRKAFEAQGKTRLALEPWEEHISRDMSVNAAKAALASKVVEGFAGSWAAQYHYGWGSTVVPSNPTIFPESVIDVDPLGPPVPIRAKTHHLGKRGPPEINFVPYNWRTNTFGNKGPSLVGHPISFEVVGPTLKSPFTNWTWDIAPGAGAAGGDLLTVGTEPSGAVSPLLNDIIDMYGPRSTDVAATNWVIGDAAEPNGGLYLLVTDDGVNAGSLNTGGGQVPMGALPAYLDTAKYELFRIVEITATTIEIHPNKSFSNFFDLPGPRSVRAITIIRPYVSRLAAIPQSGAAGGNDGVSTSGREQVFVTVSPEYAAGNDNFPPYDGGNGFGSGDGSWIGGGFTNARAPFGSIIPGEATAYGGRVRLPIPIPVCEALGSVETTAFAPTALTGNWTLEVTDSTIYSVAPLFSSRLPIVRINVTERQDDLPALTLGTIPSCLGWFDVVDTTVGPDTVVLARVPETDPQTGLTYWGPGPWEANLLTPNVNVGLTLHEAVEALWDGPFNIDKVEASRLKNLINPHWVSRFEKQVSDPTITAPPPPGGSGAGRPDKAMFDTRTFSIGGPILAAANPGNLMDLGFRMVLYPAKADPNDITRAIPDFNNPIMGRELLIDGSLTEKQYLEVDYSSGIVRLSHPPPTSRAGIPDEPTEVIPNGIQGTGNNNPRGEVILYAACVPYSMEDSQLGTGNRITANRGPEHRDFDLYSQEVFAKVVFATTIVGGTVFLPGAPFIDEFAGGPGLVLDRIWDGPETGVLTITAGSNTAITFGRFGYTRKTTTTLGVAPDSTVVTLLTGISSFPAALNPDPSIFPGEQTRAVVLRREVFFGTESFSLPAGSDRYPGDTTYGSAARADTLRFERATTVPALDGSITIRPLPDLATQLDRPSGAIVASKLTVPLNQVLNPAPFGFQYFSENGFYQGLQYDSSDASVPNKGWRFVPQVPVDSTFTGPGANLGPAMFTDLAGPGAPVYHGVITPDGGIPGQGLFNGDANFRFVAKAGAFYRGGVGAFTGFVGLVKSTIAVSPTISLISDPTLLPPTMHVIGFQFDSASTTWRYWVRGSGGDTLLPIIGAPADPALIGAVQGPFYFVIETNFLPNDQSLVNLDDPIVKMGVYDGHKTLINSVSWTHRDTIPTPGGLGYFTSAACRDGLNPSGLGDLYVWFMNVTTNIELEDLPPLP